MPKETFTLDYIMFMKEKGRSNCSIAEELGVSEGTIRYRIKRIGKPDLRSNRPSGLDPYQEVIKGYLNIEYDKRGEKRRPTLKVLYSNLRDGTVYKGSYDSFCHWVKRHYPEYSKLKPYIRIETPPGVLMSVDWKESVPVNIGREGNIVRINILVFQLSFSRKPILLVFKDRRLTSFISGHLEAFNRFGGYPEVIRTDCLKSAVLEYKGRKSLINSGYAKMLKRYGIGFFPSRPRTPRDKGKVERLIRSVMDRVYVSKRVFADLSELQMAIDRAVSELEKDLFCGATGLSVSESFDYEKKHLKPLKDIDFVYPLQERIAVVKRDGTVVFCNNSYQVERRFVGKTVYCVRTRLRINIYYDNELIGDFPYLPKSKGMVMLSEKALKDITVIMSSWTREKALEAARRQVEIYEKITAGGQS